MAAVAHTPRLISLKEAASMLGVHVDTLRRAVADGNLPAVRIGPRGWLKFRVEDIERLLSGEREAA